MVFAAKIYLAALVIMSIVAFVAFGWDKRQAQVDGRRIPEKTLFTIAMLGGWPGAIAGQQYFRHKTVKMSFRVVLWGIVALHLILVGVCLYFR